MQICDRSHHVTTSPDNLATGISNYQSHGVRIRQTPGGNGPAGDEPEGDLAGFSDTQIDTIRSTWPLLSCENTRVGVEVFVRIFREAPTIHALFHHFNINSVEDLHHSKVFKEHAGRFMGIIQDLVDHLETPQDVDQNLLILGAKHATFDGYHPEYFRFYTKCMMDVWETELGEEFIHEVRDSWRLAFDYIVERMTEGFDMCLSGQIQDVLNNSMPPSTSLKGWAGQGQVTATVKGRRTVVEVGVTVAGVVVVGGTAG